MNIVIKHNISIILYSLLYLALTIILVSKFDVSVPLKVTILIVLIMIVKPLKMILIYMLLYISVISGNKDLIPFISSHIFESYLETKHNLTILNTRQRPCIYVTNYPIPFYNYLITELLPENTVLIGGGGNMFYNVSLLAKHSFPIDLKNKGNFNKIKEAVSYYNKQHFNILVFVEEVHLEETKRKLSDIGRIKTGIFSIAKDLSIPVVPIYIGVMKYNMAIPVSNVHYIYAKKSQVFVDDVNSTTNYISKFFHKHKLKHRNLRLTNSNLSSILN